MRAPVLWIVVSGFLILIALAAGASLPGGLAELPTLGGLLRLAGVWALTFVFSQYVLASRVPWIEGGMGQDRLLRYHRWFGRTALGLASLHLAAIVYRDLRAGAGLVLAAGRLPGLTALLLLMVTGFTASFHRTLGLRYESWKGLHLANYVVFPILLVHVFSFAARGALPIYPYALLTLSYAVLFAHRIVGVSRVRRNPYRVAEVVPEIEGIWTLRFQGPPLEHLPGQFMHVQLLRDGKLSSSHPFTISSSPTDALVSITPKEQGDFTSTLGDTRPGDLAYIDAPYGVFSYLRHSASEKMVFIAGGIGITPFMSMLRYMRARDRERNVMLLWANRSEATLCFREELAAMGRELPGFEWVPVMSDQPDWPGERGYIDAELLTRRIPELTDRSYYLCGPPPMLHAVRRSLANLGVPDGRIRFELFEL